MGHGFAPTDQMSMTLFLSPTKQGLPALSRGACSRRGPCSQEAMPRLPPATCAMFKGLNAGRDPLPGPAGEEFPALLHPSSSPDPREGTQVSPACAVPTPCLLQHSLRAHSLALTFISVCLYCN